MFTNHYILNTLIMIRIAIIKCVYRLLKNGSKPVIKKDSVMWQIIQPIKTKIQTSAI